MRVVLTLLRNTVSERFIMATRRIFAISDLHIDYKANLQFVENWSPVKYQNDILVVAGDVTDNIVLLESTLKSFKSKFHQVFYVPGNHELWIRSTEAGCSITKFHKIVSMCKRIEVHTSPKLIDVTTSESVWIVPLFSWYAKPEEDPEDSLYRRPPSHVTVDVTFSEQVWMDNHLCKWTNLPGGTTPSMYFTDMNKDNLRKDIYENHKVISFSHFLPRWDLIPGTEEEMSMVQREREQLGVEGELPKFQGGVKGFNFARYAGCKTIERQLREIGSVLHVHGHQHRNRDRVIDGVRYVSHCLGNPKEQEAGWVWGLTQWKGPKEIWPSVSTG